MKGDFSRNTFDRLKHFKGVRMQQGRVQLDADWNENLDILLHRIETETMDVIGLCGFPIHAPGFGVVADTNFLSPEEEDWLGEMGYLPLADGDFVLTAGRAYVDGILCEVENLIPYTKQPHILPAPKTNFPSNGTFVVYLDVWERLITALEDSSIREVALGGPDTTVRSQVVWQVKADIKAGGAEANLDCDAEIANWPPEASNGRLSARTHPEPAPDDPCTVPPGAGYKRLENQLYRVEIHRGSDDSQGATYKWSRDNGSVVIKVAEFSVDASDDKIRVTSLGRDNILGLQELQWVEVQDDARELAGLPGQLVQIKTIDRERLIVTLKENVTGFDINLHPKLRRWDSVSELKVEVPATNDGFLLLEEGVEVHFVDGGIYRSGDYWTIAARTVPGQYGDIEWPDEFGEPAFLRPFGITHHYCKLALIVVVDGKIINVTDCRDKFPPLTELPTGGESCCSVTVGEGGDFADIQQALDARPADNRFWNICLLAGEHKLQKPVVVDGQEGVGFSGCSDQALVTGAGGQPLFKISDSRSVRIEGLMLQATAQEGAILALNCIDFSVKNCRGQNSTDVAGAAKGEVGPMLVAVKCKELTVQSNMFRALPALVIQGGLVLVSDNFFTGGGVQVLFGSQMISIEQNLIMKGQGPGIQLSGGLDLIKEGMFKKTAAKTEYESRYVGTSDYRSLEAVRATRLVTIKHNLISGMRGSGIVTLTDMVDLESLGEVSYLVIDHNEIISCAYEPDISASAEHKVGGGIVLALASDVTIQGNLVARNGKTRSPACGILVANSANVEISGNQVTDNGSNEEEASAGYQAGIAVLFAIGNDITTADLLSQNLNELKAGTPALRVHGNLVSTPAGLAFNALALGTVQVIDNSFVTRGRRNPGGLFPAFLELAAGVQITNLGLQSWLAGLAGGLAADVHYEAGEGASLNQASKIMPDGRIMFNDNQVTLTFSGVEGRDPKIIPAGLVLFSRDDISLQGNQVQSDVTPDKLLSDGIAIGATIRAMGNSFSEPGGSAFYSYVSQGTLMNSTIGNQAVHCIYTASPRNIDLNNQVLLAQLCQRLSNLQGAIYLARQETTGD